MMNKILIAALVGIAVGYYVSKSQIQVLQYHQDDGGNISGCKRRRCIGQIV